MEALAVAIVARPDEGKNLVGGDGKELIRRFRGWGTWVEMWAFGVMGGYFGGYCFGKGGRG